MAKQTLPKYLGYRRPPTETQFRKGMSGNPNGRPRGAKNLRTLIKEAAGKKVSVNEDGKRRKRSKLDLAVTQMMNKAVLGEARFMQMALDHVRNAETASSASAGAEFLQEVDRLVIQQVLARIRRQPGESENE